MPATKEQLKERWHTDDGKKRLAKVIEALQRGEDWAPILEGFPHVEEVANGRDLRNADLSGADLSGGALVRDNASGADLNDANLIKADVRGANLIKADLSKADLSKADLREAHLELADLGEANLFEANLCGAYLIKADLSGADLTTADLGAASLSGANLGSAHLSGADVCRANLFKANLRGAYLIKADLRRANLVKADLRKADLREADLGPADLDEANLFEANLRGANLRGANLRGAVLNKADLTAADLREARLIAANLSGAKLRGADLSAADLRDAQLRRAELRGAVLRGATLSGADLSEAKLSAANLIGADLQTAAFTRAVLDEATLTGANLYATERTDWSIKGIKCNYVYWDEEGKKRSPADRDLEPGEFERLYASLPTIEYVFEHGMTPMDLVVMDRVVQAIREEHPELDLKIATADVRGAKPTVKLTVQLEEHKEPAQELLKANFQAKVAELEAVAAERDRVYGLVHRLIDGPTDVRIVEDPPPRAGRAISTIIYLAFVLLAFFVPKQWTPTLAKRFLVQGGVIMIGLSVVAALSFGRKTLGAILFVVAILGLLVALYSALSATVPA